MHQVLETAEELEDEEEEDSEMFKPLSPLKGEETAFALIASQHDSPS